MNQQTILSPNGATLSEIPFDKLSNAIDKYMEPIIQHHDRERVNSFIGHIGATGFLKRYKHEIPYKKAYAQGFDAVNLAMAIRAHALEYDTPMTQATFAEKFKFRMRFLRIIFSLPAMDERSGINLQKAFEEFLSARKLIDLSHF